VAQLVFDNNLARVERPADLEAFIRSQVYKPEYHSFV
jgi:malate dehydrogenase (oxaloacetate-decarboxylating)(NADP+)